MKTVSAACVGLTLLCFAAGATAQQLLDPSPTICAQPLTKIESQVVDATALMINGSRVHHNPDGTYRIDHAQLTEVQHDNGPTPICAYSTFLDEETANTGRTAVMIGDKTFITASHDDNFDASSYRVVFGPPYDDMSCQDFSWENIPPENVYSATQIGSTNIYANDHNYDYFVFRVDRNVVGRNPVKVRRSGSPRIGDPYVMVGHPMFLATRIDRFGSFVGREQGSNLYLFSNLYPFEGSSGSAVFNLEDEVMEVGVKDPIQGIHPRDPVNQCDYFADKGYPGRTNGEILPVANFVPRAEVLVSPLADISHAGAIGGPVSNAVSTYEITGAPESNQYSVSAVGNLDPNGPSLVSNIAPGDYLASLVHPTTLTLTADTANVSACGVWDYQINVRDRANDQNNYIRHHFEVGMMAIETTPADGWDARIFGQPVPASKIYTVTNTMPVSATARARIDLSHPSVGLSLFLIDGVAAETFTLAPSGQPGDHKDLLVAVNPLATLPADGIEYDARAIVDLTNAQCALTAPVTIPLSFVAGSQVFAGIGSGDLIQPPQTGLSNPTAIAVDADDVDGWCVAGARLDMGFLNQNAGGSPLVDIDSVLDIRLIAPDGTPAHLWAQNSIPPAQLDAYVDFESVDAYGTTFPTDVLHLDDQTSPPLGPDSFLPLVGRAVSGTWTVEIRRAPGAGTVIPFQVRIGIDGVRCSRQ